jgi:thiol-disulfide isomerase/thioredoxin
MWWMLPACATLGGVPLPPYAATESRASTPVTQIDAAGLAALLTNPTDRVRVVNFWATWCGPCADELPSLEALARARPDIDVVLVSVDHANDGPWVSAFAGSLGISRTVHHLVVPDAPAALRTHVARWPGLIPVTLVLEPGGHVRAQLDGAVDRFALDAALRVSQ